MIELNSAKCPKDHVCPMIASCPVGAISQKGFNLPTVDAKKRIWIR